MITITAYKWVPPFAQGLVRDLRARWALEESGLPYRVNLIAHPDRLTPDHIAKQPFAQIPVLEEDGLTLFESGAIVLHIAEKSESLLPQDPAARARTIQWVFAALNSVEQFVQGYVALDAFYRSEEWAKLRKRSAREELDGRLSKFSERLGDNEYLEDRFTVGDLMMSNVLRILRSTDVLEQFPNLAAYRARCETRPAFQRALAGQLGDFEKQNAA
ncbi:MAG TPA: glutathione S-transferase family protein [Rhizomicrobium sp.]|jgi:glutathione S-transferase|nr:glutathione S-transferase family protein [Rhizomicrobium sp.]